MLTWPATLPQRMQVTGLSDTFGQGAIRQDMDAGPAFQRPRYTATVEPIAGQMLLDRTQYATLKQFWTDTGSGALSFAWVHPISEADATLRFDAAKPPQIAAQSGVYFTVQLAVEVLP